MFYVRNTFRHILLWISFGLVVGHSLLPHTHQLSGEKSVYTSAHTCEDIMGVFAHGLAADTGSGHLETFRSTSFSVVWVCVEVKTQPSLPVPCAEAPRSYPFEADLQPPAAVFLPACSLRGPPLT
ncbi:MAG: hypothetical protein EAZ89_11645 [Bacteroidetes bacterium]|nr:MAG: hypothetical protein EAZ89_11645 [Bacteroidota bacterium]